MVWRALLVLVVAASLAAAKAATPEPTGDVLEDLIANDMETPGKPRRDGLVTRMALRCFYGLHDLPPASIALVSVSVVAFCAGVVLLIIGCSRMRRAKYMEMEPMVDPKARNPHPFTVGGTILLLTGLVMLVTTLGVTVRSPPSAAIEAAAAVARRVKQ